MRCPQYSFSCLNPGVPVMAGWRPSVDDALVVKTSQFRAPTLETQNTKVHRGRWNLCLCNGATFHPQQRDATCGTSIQMSSHVMTTCNWLLNGESDLYIVNKKFIHLVYSFRRWMNEWINLELLLFFALSFVQQGVLSPHCYKYYMLGLTNRHIVN